jgi:membrane protein DedA with SNARE-associated domain
VEETADEVIRWLQGSEGPLGYAVLALASLIEYVVPPFPGDTIALFGIFLAATAGWSAVWVYLALNLGATAGGMIAYGFGRAVAAPERRPRGLRGARTERAIDTITARYRKHGVIYLAVNRFVPALRAFFFVGAGIARLPWPSVALWGGLSAAAWNGLLLALGWAVGASWERMLAAARAYSAVATVLIVAAIALLVLRTLVRRARKQTAEPEPDEPPPG